ncbi:hypothetical protein [uncultured Mediterranean phage]|nr:hypothetical protein [uncultured Mediterranean phage]
MSVLISVVAKANGFRLVDMSFMGTVGSVAQAAYAATAPTAVSIATTSSGNYDDAFLVYSKRLGSAGEDSLASNDGSGFSSNAGGANFVLDSNYNAQLNNNGGLIEFGVKGYIRATGATSFQWDMNTYSLTTSSGSISSGGISGTASTDQDETGSGDIGESVSLQHTSGGRGYNHLDAGDTVSFEVDASATNAGGTTDASTCSFLVSFIS